MTQTNSKNAAAEVLAGVQKGNYTLTPATARLLDCLRAGSAYYEIIADAWQLRYGDILTAEQIEELLRPFLEHINAIEDLLHNEIGTAVIDALSDTANTAADNINI